MSQNTTGPRKTFVANADLSAKQYYIMKVLTGNKCDLAAAATDPLVGTLNNKPKSADSADVTLRSGGMTGLVVCGGTITVGDEITSDGSGKAITTTTGGDQVLGTALESAVSGDIVEYMPSMNRYAVT